MKKSLIITLIIISTLFYNIAYSKPMKGGPHRGPMPTRHMGMRHMPPPPPPHVMYGLRRPHPFVYVNSSYCPIGCNCINYSTFSPRSSFGFAISI